MRNSDVKISPDGSRSAMEGWRAAVAFILIVAGALFIGTVCKSTDVSRCFDFDNKECATDGWLGDNAFRITVAQMPERSLTDSEDRKKSAKKSAVQWAQKMIIKKIHGSRQEGAAYHPDIIIHESETAREFKDIVESGVILNERYDSEQNCEIIFEIKAEKLRNKVMGIH